MDSACPPQLTALSLCPDIQFLSHETIIDQMREMKIFKRKLKKVRRRTLAAALRRGC